MDFKQYSTNHAPLSIVEQIRTAIDNNTFSCGVFIYLEKAFDTVNHQILLTKLYHYGIRGVANKWFYSYLTNRYQKVSLNGESSQRLPITCGVPHGSILGPLLFLLYINDMHLCVMSSTIHHFADDTNLLYSCKSLTVLRKSINKDIELLYDWLCANRLSLNTKLFESPKIKYLGLILDNKLDWKGHITELSKKIIRAVGLLYKIRNLYPTSVLRSLYYSILNSHLLYGLVVWGNANRSYINKIKYLQKRALRCIVVANYDRNIDTNIIHFDLKILNLDHQFQTQLSSLMWVYDHDVLPLSLRSHFKRANLVHTYNTRTSAKGSLYYSEVNTSKYGLKSFKYQGIKILNDLKNMSIYQTATSKSKFAKELKSDLLSSYTA